MALSKKFQQTVEAFADTEIGKLSAGLVTLQKNIYIKVVSVQATKQKAIASVSFSDAGDAKQYEFEPKMDGENFIRQAYLYLKTLPEFFDTVDC